MIEAVLAAVIVAQGVGLAAVIRAAGVERRRLLHAVIAKDSAEYCRLETITPVRTNKARAAKSDPVIPYGL